MKNNETEMIQLFNEFKGKQWEPNMVSTTKIKEKIHQDLDKIIMLYLLANMADENIQLKDFLNGFEKNIIISVLKITGGSQKMSADILGVKPSAFFEKLKKYNITQRVRTYRKREN